MKRLLTVLLLVALLASGCARSAEVPPKLPGIPETTTLVPSSASDQLPETSPQLAPTPESQEPTSSSGEQPVKYPMEEPPAGITYEYVTEKPTGWFKTGQEADVILYGTGFNESGGRTTLNHPYRVATDGQHLVVTDTWNNRVLIWNNIPSKINEPPDLVLGQPNFDTNLGRLGSDGMNHPMGVATDGEKLLVADANNDRILIWDKFPTRNGQPADLVLGAPDFDSWPDHLEMQPDGQMQRDPTRRIYCPWDVWTDGDKVIVTSTTDSSVLIWNEFPTENNQPADIVLGHDSFEMRFADTSEIPGYEPDPLAVFATTRSITSDGNRLVIGTYENRSAYVWNEFPSKSGQPADFILQVKRVEEDDYCPVWGLDLKDDQLFLVGDQQVYVWNEFPRSNRKEDFRIGTTDERLGDSDFGSPQDVATDGKRVFVADTHNNRIMIFNQIPQTPNTKADVVLGQPDFETDWLKSKNSFTNPSPFSDGEHLFIGSDLDNKIGIYHHLPDESKATPDVMIRGFDNDDLGVVHQITTAGEKLIAANREAGRVLIWNKMTELDNTPPDVILGITSDQTRSHGKGKADLDSPVGVTTDGTRLFVSDFGNNRVLIWHEIPTQSTQPADLVLGQVDFDSTETGSTLDKFESVRQISTDGQRLAVADSGNNRILIWNSIPTRDSQPADFEIKAINLADSSPTGYFSFPSGVYIKNDSLFVSDIGNNRVLIWSTFPESGEDEPDIVLGQPDFTSRYKSNSNYGLFSPATLCFDGSFLWVGETKFSNRLLRFSVQPVD